jgi:hypothetical protein
MEPDASYREEFAVQRLSYQGMSKRQATAAAHGFGNQLCANSLVESVEKVIFR